MKNYKLTDEHPFTYPQLLSFCSNFFKRRFVVKLIDEAVKKDGSLKEEAFLANKPKTFYLNQILTVMGEIDSAFKKSHEDYVEKRRKEKEKSSREPGEKLLNAIFG